MPNVVWRANPGPQTAFLKSKAREVFYGGAAGGGKTDALIMAPLYRVNHPKHRSIVMRRTYPNLLEVRDRMGELYPEIAPAAKFHETEARWTFPSGATIQLGYAQHEDDILGYKSFEYDLICVDELTSFTEKMYRFLFSRNRTKSADLPPIIRSGSNPGDIGHDWVYSRFIENREPFHIYDVEIKDTISGAMSRMSRQFIPAKVWDNPKMPNMQEYITGLMAMGEDDAAAYLHGIWTRFQGQMFKTLPKEVPAKPKSEDYYVIRAMDYGYEDWTCVLWFYCYPDNTAEVVDELYVQHTIPEGIADMVRVYEERMKFPKERLRWSVGDPSMFKNVPGQDIAYQMSQHGYWMSKANNDRVAGWTQVRSMLDSGRLAVWEAHAPQLLRTLSSLRRHPKKVNDAAPWQEDHAPDALRYGTMVFYEKPPEAPPEERPNPNQDTYFDELMENLTSKRKGSRYNEFFNGSP